MARTGGVFLRGVLHYSCGETGLLLDLSVVQIDQLYKFAAKRIGYESVLRSMESSALSAMDLGLLVINPQDAFTGTCNLSSSPALLASPVTSVLLGGAIVAKTMDITTTARNDF